jgi:hypothetical protein
MFNEIFNATTSSIKSLSIESALITMLTAFVLGMIISFTYMKTHSRGHYSQNFSLTLVMIPCIIALIILLIGDNLATAFGLSGAFSIIRFRSTAGDPKDIAYVFFTMAVGLACGVGLFGYAAIFCSILCVIMFILSRVNFGALKTTDKMLKIVIPEDLDYQGVFDDIFRMYTVRQELKRVKTTDLGTLYELVYIVTMKNGTNEKEFLDAIRCRNGNLNVILVMNASAND